MDAASLLVILASLAAALAGAGWLSHRLRLPPALGYLAVGAIASPAIRQTPSLHPALLEPAAQVGVLFLLFVIGLELDLKKLQEVLRRGAVVLPLDILVPGLLGTAAGRLAGWSFPQSLALGLALSLSSTLFGERLAGTPGFGRDSRQRTLGVLLSEDVAAVALLALLAILGNQSATPDWWAPAWSVAKLLLLFVLLTAFALLVVPRLLDGVARTHSHELVVLVGGAAVLGFGYLGYRAGSAELGALMAGVAAAEAGSRFVVRNGLQSVRDLALALFFFTSGLATDMPQVLGHPVLVLAAAALFLFSKLVVHVPAALVGGLGFEASLRSGLALGTMGEFNLILVAAAGAAHLAHPLLGTAIVGAMLVLLVVSPLLLRAVPALARAAGRLPAQYQRPLRWMIRSLRASRPTVRKPQQRGRVIQLLANLLLLGAWIALCVGLGPILLARLVRFPTLGPVVVTGLAVAVSLPLLWGAYRSYRGLVHAWAGMEDEPPHPAGRAKVRLVDAAVAVVVLLLLIPVAFLVDIPLPALVGGLVLAFLVAAAAWRRMGLFHRTLEDTVTRVLGQEPEAHAMLDHVMEQYPWGVRFAAVAVPPGSPVVHQSLKESRLRDLTGAIVAVLQRRGHEIVNPSSEEVLHPGDTLVLLGDLHQIERAEALIVAHGEALRLTAQSRRAAVVEVRVRTGSPLVGATLAESDVHGRTGTLVVGVWPEGGRHPIPFRPELRLKEGDRLILLGAALQVERARLLAEGEESESTLDAGPEPAGTA